ncbi:TRAP transporter small permease [Paracoccus aestuariivivens]|uniref:TRAP transporter small permease protein n=1 Tax=Paracoccus aestuariivivens TaxID=1820333 RepID=A0A6L6JD34_9RHOB|nr:TRAP transporter small permease subunit [Paracoccus aestuariivivens]MTH78064.1 TRAP transporter small permease subunit [Paracoccus aestuariivivens]
MNDDSGARRNGWAALTSVSQGILAIEKVVAGLLLALLLTLILLNVGTRMLRMPIYWIDEASVLTMIWLGFIGASVMIRLRIDFAVTLVQDNLTGSAAQSLRAVVSGLSLAFALGLLVMCWMWMDPLGIIGHGFDAESFAAETFNFLYTERTQTLEWPTWLVSMVIPIFAATLTIHTAANLVEDLRLCPKREQEQMTTAEEAN